jgi:hypothetical protein
MANICTQKFAGLLTAIKPTNSWERPTPEDIKDNIESEQAAIPDLAPEDCPPSALLDTDSGSESSESDGEDEALDFEKLLKATMEASKGVTERTDKEYHGLIMSTTWLDL